LVFATNVPGLRSGFAKLKVQGVEGVIMYLNLILAPILVLGLLATGLALNNPLLMLASILLALLAALLDKRLRSRWDTK
jgi:hypothetical protein